MINPDSPRRYVIDESGHRVLFGLTITETAEFEKLDSLSVVTDTIADRTWAIGVEPATAGETRWLELYAKHDDAWRAWTAKRSVTTGGPFPGLLRFS